jgi:hypothetical protein
MDGRRIGARVVGSSSIFAFARCHFRRIQDEFGTTVTERSTVAVESEGPVATAHPRICVIETKRSSSFTGACFTKAVVMVLCSVIVAARRAGTGSIAA